MTETLPTPLSRPTSSGTDHVPRPPAAPGVPGRLSGRPRPPGRPLHRLLRRLLLDTAYNLSAFVVALAGFVVVVVLLAVGLSLVMMVGGVLVIVAGAYAARGFAGVERLRLRALQGRAAPSPWYAVARDGSGWWRRALTPLRDAQIWRDVVWALVGLVTGTVAFTVTVTWWAAAGGGLSYWFWQRYLPDSNDSAGLPELLGLGDGRTPEIWLNLAMGVVALLTLPLANRVAARTHASLASALLCPRPE